MENRPSLNDERTGCVQSTMANRGLQKEEVASDVLAVLDLFCARRTLAAQRDVLVGTLNFRRDGNRKTCFDGLRHDVVIERDDFWIRKGLHGAPLSPPTNWVETTDCWIVWIVFGVPVPRFDSLRMEMVPLPMRVCAEIWTRLNFITSAVLSRHVSCRDLVSFSSIVFGDFFV